MDHLAKQENPLRGIFLKRLIADLDCVFNTVTKSEVTRKKENYRSEIEY